MDLEAKDQYWSETIEGLDCSGTTIVTKEFDGCTFRECNFSETTFSRCNFVDCEFIKCNLSVAKMEYSKFADVAFIESKLIGINWTSVDWPNLLFTAPIRFYKSILNDCSFQGLSLRELVLEECRAHHADFREGDFSAANFSYTDFAGSLFNKTDLSNADFSEATNYAIDIHQNVIKGAKFTRMEALRLLDSLEIELLD